MGGVKNLFFAFKIFPDIFLGVVGLKEGVIRRFKEEKLGAQVNTI